MAEHGKLSAFRYPSIEILVDAAGVPIGNAALPENAANFVFQRHYVVPGNFDTYFVGKGTDDFTVVSDGKTYHNTFINSSVAGGFIGRTVATLLAATQSAFFDSRLVITAGIRGDRIRFDQHGDTRLSAKDPDVRAGRGESEVPLADDHGVIAGRAQVIRDRRHLAIEIAPRTHRIGPDEAGHADPVRVTAAHQRGARRRAHGGVGAHAGEPHPFRRETIEVGRLHIRSGAIGRPVADAKIVGENDDDVGPDLRSRRAAREKSDGDSGTKQAARV